LLFMWPLLAVSCRRRAFRPCLDADHAQQRLMRVIACHRLPSLSPTGVIMTELGRHMEKTLNPALRFTLMAGLSWAFKSIPQVRARGRCVCMALLAHPCAPPC
jgi:hypothetical protein